MSDSTQKHKYTIPFRVRSYEVSSDRQATLASVCNYFQEAAGLHAHHLNFDISQLQENNLTWVLYKMHVRMETFPDRWQDIEVTTWPSSGDGIRAFRDYQLKSKNGDILGVALSQWMVLSLETRRPVRIPQEILDMGVRTDEHVIGIDKNPLKSTDPSNAEFLCRAGQNDLDMNNHVNNVSYIDWITALKPPGWETNRCCEISIQYLAEAVSGDEIYIASVPEDEPGVFRHTLFKSKNYIPVASAVTWWE